MFLLIFLCVCLTGILIFLTIKIWLLRYSLREIRIGLKERLEQDTNTLLTVSSRDSSVRELAAGLNQELIQLREKRQRFQNGDLELKEAVTGISHDLRTPLTAICGYLDLLKQEEKSEAAEKYLAIIENRTERLKQISEELFRYSVTSSTVTELFREEVSLGAALEESIAAFYGACKEKGIAPLVSMPKEKVIRLLDPKALSRILENILGNALKYSDGGVWATLRESGELIVSNPAKNLDAVAVGRLFDRFYTVETGKEATGIGLSIARLLTEQMGGNITAEYDSGRLFIRLYFPENKKE